MQKKTYLIQIVLIPRHRVRDKQETSNSKQNYTITIISLCLCVVCGGQQTSNTRDVLLSQTIRSERRQLRRMKQAVTNAKSKHTQSHT